MNEMNEATVYHIDPDADTVINLRISHKQRAPVPEQPKQPDKGSSGNVTSDDRTEATTATPGVVETPKSEDRYVQYYVSSKHLMLASRWFKRCMADKSFIESTCGNEDNLYRILAEDWDEDAYLFLMHALHLQHRMILRPITLETLAKVALIVDYYDCQESLSHLAEVWTMDAKINNEIPQQYCRDLVLWIWVSWVFKLEKDFKQSTQVALRQLDEEQVTSWGLPIPDRLLDKLKTRRIQIIERIMSGLDKSLENYASDSYFCPHLGDSSACSAMLSGSLYCHMRKQGLSHPRPEAPFNGLSFSVVYDRVSSITVPEWDPGRGYHGYGHICNFSESVVKMAKNVTNEAKGLSINEYL